MKLEALTVVSRHTRAGNRQDHNYLRIVGFNQENGGQTILDSGGSKTVEPFEISDITEFELELPDVYGHRLLRFFGAFAVESSRRKLPKRITSTRSFLGIPLGPRIPPDYEYNCHSFSGSMAGTVFAGHPTARPNHLITPGNATNYPFEPYKRIIVGENGTAAHSFFTLKDADRCLEVKSLYGNLAYDKTDALISRWRTFENVNGFFQDPESN